VIHIGGFDPVDSDRLNHRMAGGVAKFAALWNFEAHADAPEISADGRVMNWRVKASGPNWTTVTDFTLLRWDNLIDAYVAKSRWRKLVEGSAAILHFTLNGTVFRYFSANGRYGMFVLYPFFLVASFGIIAYLVGKVVAGIAFAFAAVFGVVAGLLVFAGLVRWVGPYFHLYFALADWSFAADLASERVAGLEDCYDQFVEEIVRRIRNCGCEEVVLCGVSLGAVMMVEALARAIRLVSELGRGQSILALLTVGSSILKIGLHPEATSLKSSVARVSA
jgi:hypothetical protein